MEEEKIQIEEEKKDRNNGGKHLFVLGISTVAIALATSVASLIIYHNSGDIYLDRSRPGYLPDKEETDERINRNADYTVSDNGTITPETIDEYLENLDKIINQLDSIDSAFSETPLSDQSLGL